MNFLDKLLLQRGTYRNQSRFPLARSQPKEQNDSSLAYSQSQELSGLCSVSKILPRFHTLLSKTANRLPHIFLSSLPLPIHESKCEEPLSFLRDELTNESKQSKAYCNVSSFYGRILASVSAPCGLNTIDDAGRYISPYSLRNALYAWASQFLYFLRTSLCTFGSSILSVPRAIFCASRSAFLGLLRAILFSAESLVRGFARNILCFASGKPLYSRNSIRGLFGSFSVGAFHLPYNKTNRKYNDFNFNLGVI